MLAALLVALALLGPASSEAACDKPRSRQTLTSFVDAFNGGNVFRLDMLFARGSEFRWYSSGLPGRRVDGAAYSRNTLMAYFAARHRQRDHLWLSRFTFHGQGNFEFRMMRSANGFRGGRAFLLHGKGAISCSTGKLIVMSLSGPVRQG